jgi:hypothetical protein
MENTSNSTIPKERPLTAAFEAMAARTPMSPHQSFRDDPEALRREAQTGTFQGFGSPPGKF